MGEFIAQVQKLETHQRDNMLITKDAMLEAVKRHNKVPLLENYDNRKIIGLAELYIEGDYLMAKIKTNSKVVKKGVGIGMGGLIYNKISEEGFDKIINLTVDCISITPMPIDKNHKVLK
jgi:hypothetical protein